MREEAVIYSKEVFREIGHSLIDEITDFIENIPNNSVTPGVNIAEIKEELGKYKLADDGVSPNILTEKVLKLLINNSLFNGHPKFMGYITSSPHPIGILGDLIASSINPNMGAQILSPAATEIEKQTISMLSDFVGLKQSYSGLLVSGGNMANFTGFLAGRTAKFPVDFKDRGFLALDRPYHVYCSKTTHTWIDKAASLFGHGKDAVRWIETNSRNQMDIEVLEETIKRDAESGAKPFMVIGTAGDVSTGAVDDLKELASICKRYDLWFHIDGAYGAPAAVLEENTKIFEGLEVADSIALDPHKWLYAPLEAGCTLVRDPKALINTFSSNPDYYKFDDIDGNELTNFFEYGLQNSRGFRALKVWLGLKQFGRIGYQQLISEDIELSKYLFDLAEKHPELEAVSQNLSITTLRYKPVGETDEAKLNILNESILGHLQKEGEMFLSNAVVKGVYCLRSCIVNFRTTKKDIEEVIDLVVKKGRELSVV